MPITYQRSVEPIDWDALARIIHAAGLGTAQPEDPSPVLLSNRTPGSPGTTGPSVMQYSG
jgi:hypothetical protein